MRLLKHLAALALVLYAASSAAADPSHTIFQTWSSVNGTNIIRVILPPGTSPANPSNCPDTDSYFVLATTPKEVQARIYSTLLTARALGSSVSFRLSSLCESGRPAIVDAYFPTTIP